MPTPLLEEQTTAEIAKRQGQLAPQAPPLQRLVRECGTPFVRTGPVVAVHRERERVQRQLVRVGRWQIPFRQLVVAEFVRLRCLWRPAVDDRQRRRAADYP